MIDAVLDYAKVPVMIQSYYNSQLYFNSMGTPSNPKDTKHVAATSSTSEEVDGLKINDNGTFTLDENFYPLKAFILEGIYLGNIPKVFGVAPQGEEDGSMTQSR